MLLRVGEQFLGANGGARLPKCCSIRVYHSQAGKAEVAHGARGRTQVERVTRGHQNHPQAFEFSRNRQARLFYETLLSIVPGAPKRYLKNRNAGGESA